MVRRQGLEFRRNSRASRHLPRHDAGFG